MAMQKNKHGMLRSAEFMKNNPEQAPGLHHMRVHMANADGMVKVTHHAGPDAKAHAEHMMEGAEPLADHIVEHSGATYDSEGGGEHYGAEAEKPGEE